MTRNKAIFLDRDGVINHDYGHVYKIKDFQLINGVIDGIKEIKRNGYLCVIVTNQAGIAKGLYTEFDYESLTKHMLCIFESHSIKIDGVYHCPHHPNHTGQCNCRKPNPGMITKAICDLNIDNSSSYLLGDKQTDIDAGKAAGIKNSFLINSKKSFNNSFSDLKEFSLWLVENEK
jgi:D-glycero-D-manno-heptose 1,7-bisphosphate phosphatase